MPFPRPMPLVAAAGPPAIVGTWLLESIVDALEGGTCLHGLGERHTGAVIYSASGHMSIQFRRDLVCDYYNREAPAPDRP